MIRVFLYTDMLWLQSLLIRSLDKRWTTCQALIHLLQLSLPSALLFPSTPQLKKKYFFPPFALVWFHSYPWERERGVTSNPHRYTQSYTPYWKRRLFSHPQPYRLIKLLDGFNNDINDMPRSRNYMVFCWNPGHQTLYFTTKTFTTSHTHGQHKRTSYTLRYQYASYTTAAIHFCTAILLVLYLTYSTWYLCNTLTVGLKRKETWILRMSRAYGRIGGKVDFEVTMHCMKKPANLIFTNTPPGGSVTHSLYAQAHKHLWLARVATWQLRERE